VTSESEGTREVDEFSDRLDSVTRNVMGLRSEVPGLRSEVGIAANDQCTISKI
jgi:hypothetical protein